MLIKEAPAPLISCVKCITQRILSELGYINGFVLDVGCGGGYYTKIVESRCKYIIGIDIRSIFDRLKISSNLDFCLANGFKLPFRGEVFAGVVSFDVIEHVADDFKFLVEMYRVLKKGGSLLLGTPNRERLSNRIRSFVGKPVKYPYIVSRDPVLGNCVHLREYSKDDLSALLRGVGFKRVRVTGVWLGLRLKYEIGFNSFPSFLEKYSQYWLARAVKPV